MWWILAVLLILAGLVYLATTLKKEPTTPQTTTVQPEPYVPKPNEDNYYKQQAAQAAPVAPVAPTESVTPKQPEPATTSSAAITVPDKGTFEIVAKGDTGSEKIHVIIDGIKYPEQGAYVLSKNVERIRVDTPRRVDLANVVIKDVSPARDENGVDTNIRVAAIYVNGSDQNMRSRLYQAGRDPNYIRNGLLFWGGDYTFHSPDSQLDPSAQANTTLPSATGTLEITAKGDVGNEQFRVSIDGLVYPSPAGTLEEDGTVSSGAYVVPVEGAKFTITTPRRVEISNVTIKFVNDAIDPVTNKDRNIRVQSITINGESQDQRPRLFRTGLDEARLNNLRTNGGFFWGGDYTFV